MRIVPSAAWLKYARARLDGMSRTDAARKFNITYATAARFDRGDPKSSGHRIWLDLCRNRKPFIAEEQHFDENVAGPLEHEKIKAKQRGELMPVGLFTPRNRVALEALDDFEMFRRRYFGHISTGWQVESAQRILGEYEEALAHGGRKFILENVAPGSGKTTKNHDLACWVTARNRAVRGCNVSRAETLATRNTSRIKRSLERASPQLARPGDKMRGLAVDAEATLPGDYGPFKPEQRTDLWTRDAFIVVQADGSAIAEKEPTWSSYGLDSSIIGFRFDLMLCDDMVDKANIRTETSRQSAIDVFGDEIEKRLDDSGLLVVTGQRMHRRDLYRWIHDLRVDDYEELDSTPRKYTHITYPAHFEDRCQEDHGRDAEPYPEGCLLEPIRLGWRVLQTEKGKDPAKFELIYNQDDTQSEEDQMVKRSWIYDDPCAFDRDRSAWQLHPQTVDGYSVITVDPSPVKFWGCHAWYYVPGGDDGLGGLRYLLATESRRMDGPDLLDFNYAQGEWYGLLEEWRRAFLAIGRPLRNVVIEVNAGQRWLLQYEQARRWKATYSIDILTHTTTIHKQDANLGVESLVAPQWKFGRVRLPYQTALDRAMCERFIGEVLTWPDEPNDTVMSQWFLESKLPQIYTPVQTEEVRPFRPSWLLSDTMSPV